MKTFAALLVFVASVAVACGALAQQPASAFFESARTSLSMNDLARLQPAAGTAMRPLTVTQSVDNLRNYLATADASATIPTMGNAASKAAGDKLQRVLSDTSLQSAQLVSFDLRMIETPSIADTRFKLCEGAEPYCSVVRSRRRETLAGGVQRMLTTIGGVEGKPHGQAIFIRDEGDVHGILNVAQRTYVLRPLANGVFVITSAKTGELERSKDDVLDLKPQPAPAKPSSGTSNDSVKIADDSCPNPATVQVLEVLAMWTQKASKEALATGHSVRQLVRTAEAVANFSFRNSNINGEVRAKPIGAAKYAETGDMYTDVQELLKEGGRTQDVRNARRREKADVAVLIVDHPDSTNCGIAAGISVPKDKAYAVVNWKCITDKFSFIHEIGHLAGAWHDPRALGSGYNVQPPYAHGYVTGGNEPMATIMAYRESCAKPCGRGWFWSNPHTKNEEGQVLGTPDKSFDACVWRQRLPVMVNFDGG